MYLGSDGRCYSEGEIRERCESGAWEFCAGEEATGQEIVETEDGDFVLLTPVEADGERLNLRIEDRH